MRWITPPPPAAPLTGYSPLLAAALHRRGIQTPAQAEAFLHPEQYQPASAYQLPGMEKAVGRISAALRRGEVILVWGDFDVDGQTATSILVETLSALGAKVQYHIPNRARESHGMALPRLKEKILAGAQLILTCDTGITAHSSIAYAQKAGVDVIVTDHHDLGETLPPAFAIVNPKQLPPEHPLAPLPGAGVAYKLAEALLQAHSAALAPSTLLDLAALGTIADLATLRGDARWMAQMGLRQLRQTKRPGLLAMLQLADLNPQNLTESHIGFQLAPRLNALGRLEDANPAVELLTTQDPAQARLLANHLEGLNAQRKLLCDQVTMAAEAQLRENPLLLMQPALVLAHPAWHGGVLGIVAARLTERYQKPTILLCSGEDGISRGSARSVEGIHITEAIAAQKDLLLNFGGHPMAAGMGMETEKLPEFRRRLAKAVQAQLANTPPEGEEPTLTVDAWLGLADLSLGLAAEMEQLAPFGPGNERLTLATRSLEIVSTTVLGNGEHLKLTVQDIAGNKQQVLWWGGAGEALPAGRFDLAYTLRGSDYKGKRQTAIEFVALRPVEDSALIAASLPPAWEVLDWRKEADPAGLVRSLTGSVIIWAEGEHKQEIAGVGREALTPADTLVIWTTPPYNDVLREALRKVNPRRVILVCKMPGWLALERLAGALKFVLNKREGRVSLTALAASVGERETVTRLGLEYFMKRGQVRVLEELEGVLRLEQGNAAEDESAAVVKSRFLRLIEESAAFRRRFAQLQNPLEDV